MFKRILDNIPVAILVLVKILCAGTVPILQWNIELVHAGNLIIGLFGDQACTKLLLQRPVGGFAYSLPQRHCVVLLLEVVTPLGQGSLVHLVGAEYFITQCSKTGVILVFILGHLVVQLGSNLVDSILQLLAL